MELSSAFGIFTTRHPDQCVRNCSLYELWEECSARLLERVLLPDHRLRSHHPTSRTSRSRKIDSPVTCLCLGAVPFYKGLETTRAFSVGVPASMMDTGCCAIADFKAFSLSVDMSLFPVTLPCAVSTLHSKPCKCSSWRCDADLRAQGILFGEIESIAHEPTVTSVIDRVASRELLLRHCLSPPIIHCESFLQCDCNAENQTRTALTLVLQRCHNLGTALRSIPITWRVQSATSPAEPSSCDAQLAHDLGFVSTVRTLGSSCVKSWNLKSYAFLMFLLSWHVHRDCAFLLAETPRSVSDRCVAEALVQWPPLETVLLNKSKSISSSAASCSTTGSLPRPLCGGIHGLDFHCQTENLLRVRQKLPLAVHWSSILLEMLPAWPTPCLRVIELLFHMWLSCVFIFASTSFEVMCICSRAPAMTSRAFWVPSSSDSSSTRAVVIAVAIVK